MFLTEGPQRQSELFVPVLPTCLFFPRIISRNREGATVQRPCHDQTPLLLEEQVLEGWGSKDGSDGKGMMRGMDLHQKRGGKSTCA